MFIVYLWLTHLNITHLFEMKTYKLKHLKKLEAHYNKKSDEDESDLDLSDGSEGEIIDSNVEPTKRNAATFGVEER